MTTLHPKKTTDPDHMNFTYFDPIRGRHHNTVSVEESSSAERPYIWVFVRETESYAKMCESQPGKGGIELTLDGARKLIEELTYLVENHYHNR